MQKMWPLVVVILVGLIALMLLNPQKGSTGGSGSSGAALTTLGIVDEKVGDGEETKVGDRVEVHYTGRLLSNGEVFDSSVKREPFELTLGAGSVIRGWDEGLIGMKVGGKRTLKIPAAMAYGERGAGSKIPPNSDLVFDIELLRIVK